MEFYFYSIAEVEQATRKKLEETTAEYKRTRGEIMELVKDIRKNPSKTKHDQRQELLSALEVKAEELNGEVIWMKSIVEQAEKLDTEEKERRIELSLREVARLGIPSRREEESDKQIKSKKGGSKKSSK